MDALNPITLGPIDVPADAIGVVINGREYSCAELLVHNVAAARRLAAASRARALEALATALSYERAAAAAAAQLAQLPP
jgi:hypothetical protein